MGHEVSRVHFVRGKAIDTLDYESGISDSDYRNLGQLETVDQKYAEVKFRNIIGPVWDPDVTGSKILEWGIPVRADFMPKSYFLKGPERPIADFALMWGSALVSQKVKDIVEELEPGIHQFFPVQLYWPGKKLVQENYFFLNVCNHIDSVHEGLSEMPAREVIYSPRYEMDVTRSWNVQNDRGQVHKIVFDRKSISECHLWRDGFLDNGIVCTNTFKDACSLNEVSGISIIGDGHEVSS